MIFNPPCATCARFDREDRTREVCTAFPGGIPTAILEGQVDHKTPVPGDCGLTYEPVAGWTE